MQRQKCTKAKRHFKGALALILESHLSNLLLKDKLAIHQGAVRTHTWKAFCFSRAAWSQCPWACGALWMLWLYFYFPSTFFIFIWRTNCLLSCFCTSCVGPGNGCTRVMVIEWGVICRSAAFPCMLNRLWLLPSPRLSIQVHVSVSRMLCLCSLTVVYLIDRITTMHT